MAKATTYKSFERSVVLRIVAGNFPIGLDGLLKFIELGDPALAPLVYGHQRIQNIPSDKLLAGCNRKFDFIDHPPEMV